MKLQPGVCKWLIKNKKSALMPADEITRMLGKIGSGGHDWFRTVGRNNQRALQHRMTLSLMN
jgi:hypothetical protein